ACWEPRCRPTLDGLASARSSASPVSMRFQRKLGICNSLLLRRESQGWICRALVGLAKRWSLRICGANEDRVKLANVSVLILLMFSTCWMPASVKRSVWHTSSNGDRVDIYTIEDSELRIRLTNYGARIVSVEAPDRNGKQSDIVLGFNNAGQ